MFKDTVTYTDYDGSERTKDLYFNISRAEIIELEMTTPGGLERRMQKIYNEKDTVEIMKFLKFLIVKSYGEKDPSGDRFIKNHEVVDSFLQTEAYSEFMMKLMSDTEFMAEFMIGIMPDVSDKVDKSALVNAAKNGTVVDFDAVKKGDAIVIPAESVTVE